MKVIVKRLDHSTGAFTLTRYIYATPDMQQEAVSAVSRSLFSNQSLINLDTVGGVARSEQTGHKATSTTGTITCAATNAVSVMTVRITSTVVMPVHAMIIITITITTTTMTTTMMMTLA